MLTYRHTDTLEVVGFNDSDYAGWVDDKKFTFSYIFMMIKRAVLSRPYPHLGKGTGQGTRLGLGLFN